jgi:hypothetical protein
MRTVAALFIVFVATFFAGVAFSPGHVFRGYPAGISFFGLCGCGLVLAVHAL